MQPLRALLVETSVSAAARRIGIGQPAMSAALSRLRDLFDDPILVRTPRGMEPTARAKALAGSLRIALADLRALVEPERDFDPGASRRAFRLSGGDYAGMTILPPLMARFQRDAPGIDVRFRYVEKIAILNLLDADEIDLALAVMDDLPKRFLSEPVLEETFVCAVRRNHPLEAEPLTLAQFAAADHLLVTERADERGYVDDVLARKGLTRRIAITVPSAALVAGVLCHSDLIATIPRRAGRRIAADTGITLIELPFAARAWTMAMIWTERTARDPGLTWLRGAVLGAAGAAV